MEPFIALGHLLKSKGHDVYCLFPQQFSHLAIESGLKVHALSKSFIELVESKEGKIAMGGKGTIFQKMWALLVLYKKSLLVNAEMVDQQHDFILKEEPDKVVYNGKSTYPMVWGIKNPGKTVLLSPVPCLIQPVKEYPHIGVHRNLGTFFNLLTYDLANTGLLANVKSTTKKYRKM
jgi:hypothetical protein